MEFKKALRGKCRATMVRERRKVKKEKRSIAIHHTESAMWPRHVQRRCSTLITDTTEISRVIFDQMTFHILEIVITIKDELRIGGQLID